MTEFDPIAYLNSRFKETLPAIPASGPTIPEPQDKASELVDARQAKMERLQAWRAKRQQAEEAKQKSYDNSVIGMLGLDPEGVAGTVANTAVAVGSGFVDVVKNIGSGINTVDAAAKAHAIPEYAKASNGRMKQGVATQEDMGILNQVSSGNGKRPGLFDQQRKETNYGNTNFQRLESMGKALQNAQAVRDVVSISDRVYRGDQQAFEEQLVAQGAGDLQKTTQGVDRLKNGEYLGGSADLVSGLAGLFANVGSAALDNPKAALGYIAENAAQLSLASAGNAGMALTNLPYAIDAFGQGIEAYQKKHGVLPSNEELLSMAGKAASLAVAETVGDKLILGAGKISELGTKGIKAAVDLASKPISREGLKKALKGVTDLAVDSAPFRVGQNAVTGALGEFATEGYQTAMEENIKGNTASAEDIYKGAAAGALVGGGNAGGVKTMEEVGRMAGAFQKRVEDTAAQKEVMDSAIKSGDVTPFLDANSPTFDLHKGMQALVGNGSQEAATPEIRKTNLEQANSVLEHFKTVRDRTQSAVDSVSPAARKEDEDALVYFKDMLAQTTDPDMKAILEDEIRTTETELAKTAIKPEEVEARQAAFDKAKQDFDKAQALHTKLTNLVKLDEETGKAADEAKLQKYNSLVKMAPEELDAQVKLADSTVDAANPEAVKASSQAASKVISLAMASPGSVSVQTAQRLAANMGNGLTQTQRDYLRAFSEARLAHNLAMSSKGVQKEVLQGDKATNQKGIVTYENEMAQAVATGNKAKAQSSLTGITKFAKDHASKLASAMEAQAKFTKTGIPQQIYSDGKNHWTVADNLLSDAERRKNGGLEIGKASARLLADIQIETTALNAAAKAMQAAFDLQFKGESAAKVQDEPAKAKTEAKPAKKVEAPAPTSRVSSTEVSKTQSTKEEISAPPERAASKEERSGEQQREVDATHFKGAESTQSSKESEQAVTEKELVSDEQVAVVEPVAETEAQSGKLTAYQEEHPEGASYTEVNLIKRGFTQEGKKDGDSTGRPLVEVKDFLTALREQKVKVSDFFEGELTGKQQELVKMFAGLAKVWDAKIEAAINRNQNLDYRYQDMFSYLVNQDGSVDQNVKTAIALAAFTTLAENIENGKHNSDADINRILLKDSKDDVSDDARLLLGKVGPRRSMFIVSAGQKAVQALGLRLKKNSPQSDMAKLEMALGAHAVKLLAEEGLIELNEVPSEEMNMLLGAHHAQGEFVDNWFIRPMRDSSNELVTKNQQIKDAYQKTLGVMDKLFGTESSLKQPSLAPIPFDQKTTRDTQMGIPSKLEEVVTRQNAQPNYVDEQKWKVVSKLSAKTVLAMSGFKELDASRIHASRRDSVEAKNDGLQREYNRMMDFVEGVLEKSEGGIKNAIYFPHSVWKQHRVGIDSNGMNPQSSKMNRHLIYKASWETEVDIDSQESLDNFKLRVLEGLGVKTDKKSNATNLAGFEGHFNPARHIDPKDKERAQTLSAAVDALVATAIYEEEMNPHFEEDILAGVVVAGEGMHSFDALMAMAQYRAAEQKGDTTFTTRLMGEIDGVTNGPMLSHLLLGAGDTAKDLLSLLNRGGFFEQGNEHTQYNIWREDPAHRDLYENTTHGMMQHAQKLMEDAKRPVPAGIFSTVYSITGNLEKDDGSVTSAGRNIIKTPLTAMVFGSSMTRAVESMAEKFVAKIYTQIEELNEKGESPASLLRSLNTLMAYGRNGEGMKGKGPLRAMSLDVSVEELMEYTFTKAQEEALKEAFRQSLGRAVRGVMNDNFGNFMEKRRTFNHASEMTFRLYNAVYTGMRKAFIEKLVKEGAVAVAPTRISPITGKTIGGAPLHDLSAKQEAEFLKSIEAVMPEISTYFSRSLAETGHSGLFIGKVKRRGSREYAYKSENKFATRVKGTGRKSMLTHGYKAVNDAPGAGTLVSVIHSSDSAISHLAATMLEVLNVHDAHGSGLKDYLQAGKNLNASTFQVMLGYSPANEMLEAFHRVLNGTSQILAQEGVPDAVKAELAYAFKAAATARNQYVEDETKKIHHKDILEHTLNEMAAMAYMSDKTKLEVLSMLAYVDQYALEGGNYAVTEADRKEAKDKYDALQLNQPASVDVALTSILEAVGATSAKTEIEEDPISKEEEEEEDQNDPPSESVNTVFGETGSPVRQGDKNLEQAFIDQNGVLTSYDALRLVYKHFSGKTDRISKFSIELTYQLGRVLTKDLKLRLVTPNTDPASLVGPVRQDPAWYNAENGKAEIYVLSSAFKNAYLTPETLLHELTHGALALIIQSELDARAAKQGYTSEALLLVEELEVLLKKAQKYVTTLDETKQAQFQPAIGSVHEMVSWGMTNDAFQREVLEKVSMQPKTKKTGLVDGMKTFIKAITHILFWSTKSRQAQAVNGMTILVNNTAGLLSKAREVKPVNVSQAMAATNPIMGYSTRDIFDALASGTPLGTQHERHLKDVLTRIVERLHGPAGVFKESLMQSQAISPADVFAKAIDTGEAPFASQLIGSGFKLSQQETFVGEQVEATMRAALMSNEGQTTAVYTAFVRLYKEAYSKLQANDFYDGDWNTASQAKKDEAQAKRDFLFQLDPDASKRSNHLARFAALAMVSPELRSKLNFATATTQRQGNGTLLGWIEKVLNMALDWFNGKLTHTFDGQKADEKLESLVSQLIDIEAKKRYMLTKRANSRDVLTPVEDTVRTVAEGIRKKIVAVGTSQFIKNRKSGLVRAAGSLSAVVAGDRVELLLQGLNEIRDQHFKGQQQGLAASLVTELRGPKAVFEAMLRATKHNEAMRKATIEGTATLTLNGFKNGGKNLTDAARAAVTQVLLRSGAHSLLADFSMGDLANLLGDKAALQKAIDSYEQRFVTLPKYRDYFSNQAKTLAYYKATGKVRGPMMMMNAGNIARMFGTAYADQITETQAQEAEEIIDILVTLYAIQYNDAADLSIARQVLLEENARKDELGNGVESLLHLHKALEKESRERLFEGSEALMQKAFVPEIYNPYIDVRAATTKEGELLEAQGFTKVHTMHRDKSDTDQDLRTLYARPDGGPMPYQTGVFSFTGLGTKGSETTDAAMGSLNHPEITRRKQAMVNGLFKPGKSFDPSKVNEVFLAPVVNADGHVTTWRYLMEDTTKDAVLERNSRFEDVMGSLAGSIVDKETTTDHNRKAVEALHEQYSMDSSKNTEKYLEISSTSSDPELRELYRMLPDDTRKAIVEIWGTEGMRVKADTLDLFFGYRKLTLSKMFDKDVSDRNAVEKLVVYFVESALTAVGSMKYPNDRNKAEAYAKRASALIRKSERIWQGLVREVKDIIVVRSGGVMLWNILSNVSLLALKGVSIPDMLRHHRVAIKGALAYRTDSAELFQLQQQRDMGYVIGDRKEVDRRIAELEDSLARNPTKELIDAGLMPSIVEDVEEDADIYSYKSAFKRKTEALTSKLNPHVVSAAEHMLMTRNTPLYKALHKSTQLSDFVARYTLYQHLTTRKTNPLSKQEALQDASDAFINYDIPMHRGLQYMDDMGLMPFIKYFFRIQRVLVKTTRDNPARVLMMLLLQNYFGNVPTVMDASLLTHIGNNPFSPGALQLPFLMDDLLTSKMAIGVFK